MNSLISELQIENSEVFRDKLCKLRNDTNTILKNLGPRTITGAINWGHLYCSEAGYLITKSEDDRYQVCIEEADPCNPDLCKVVFDGLEARGWQDVEVLTEW